MNDERDDRLIGQLRDALENDARNIDPKVSARLREARMSALDKAERRKRSLLRFSPAVAFACSMVLVIVLLNGGLTEHIEPLPGEPLAIEIVEEALDYDAAEFIEVASVPPDMTSSDIELIEDLEFFEWLEANGYAG